MPSTKDKAYRLQLRKEAIEAYGGFCVNCGESRLELLTLDHVNDDGAAHRRETKTKGGWNFYRVMRAQGWPPGLQVLCYNCNCSKQFAGRMPRQSRLLHLTRRTYGRIDK